MQFNTSRFKLAFKAMTVHFALSLLVAAVIALIVFTLWFPYPYRELAGGTELFMLVIAVDLVCGPLLTFVLYSPTKLRREILIDISLVIVIQLAALVYGISTVWQVRPLYVVQEADRLTLISRGNLALNELDFLPNELKPNYFGGPVQVSLRELTVAEREKLNAEIKAGGHDAPEHPIFYTVYEGVLAHKNGRELRDLILMRPSVKLRIDEIVKPNLQNDELKQFRFLYIVGRQYWIAIINSSGNVIDYVEIK